MVNLIAKVTRVAHLGFEVRVELAPKTGAQGLSAQITRGDARILDLKVGETVYVRATSLATAG